MNKRVSLSVALVLVFVLSGCMNTIMKDQWVYNTQYKWYKPAKIYSGEEAEANLKNAQDSITINGRQPSEIVTDKYSLRATMRWQEIEQREDTVSYSGGSFWGWDYVPTFGSSTQITNITHNKENSVTVPYKDITNIIIADNSVSLGFEGGKVVSLVSSGGISLQKLADSFYSLSKFLGNRLKIDAGFSYAVLSERKAAMLGLDYGIYVPWVFIGSPAAKSGLEVNDVILEVNGETITKRTNIQDVVDRMVEEAGKKGYFDMTVMHWEQSGKDVIKWEKRAMKIYPVVR